MIPTKSPALTMLLYRCMQYIGDTMQCIELNEVYLSGIIKMYNLSIVSLILLVFSLLPVKAYSASIDVGFMSVTQFLTIKDADSRDKLGVMRSELQYYPYISARFAESETSLDGVGYFYGFDVGYFDISTQEVNDETIDLGTSVKGTYAHLTPTVYYDFFHREPKSSLVVGIGLGIGYLEADGDAILTRTSTKDHVSINISDVHLSIGVYTEYVKNGWVFKAYGYGPDIRNGSYNYLMTDVRVIFGKRFYFE